MTSWRARLNGKKEFRGPPVKETKGKGDTQSKAENGGKESVSSLGRAKR